MDKLSLSEYWEMLNNHDWYFDCSDDGKVFARGRASLAKLSDIARQSEEHKKMFDGFKAHKFSGKPWNTDQAAKPEKA